MRGRLRLPSPHTSKVLLSAWRNVKRATAADCPQRGQKLPVNAVPQLRHSFFSADSGCASTLFRCHALRRDRAWRMFPYVDFILLMVFLKMFCMR